MTEARAGWRRVFARPEDLPETGPDVASLEARGRAALDALVDARGSGLRAALGEAWSQRADLVRFAAFSGHQLLRRLNDLLLPPLLVLLLVDLGFGMTMPRDTNIVYHGVGASFFVDWAWGLALARSRLTYLVNVWLLGDLVSSLPVATATMSLRITRVLRLLRAIKLVRLLRARQMRLPLGRLARAAGLATSVALAGAVALAGLEPATVPSWGDALWWSVVTMSTVGYGDIAPVSAWGRFVAVVLMVGGVSVFSYLAGVMATGLFDPDEDRILKQLEAIGTRLDDLHERLDRYPPTDVIAPSKGRNDST